MKKNTKKTAKPKKNGKTVAPCADEIKYLVRRFAAAEWPGFAWASIVIRPGRDMPDEVLVIIGGKE